MTANRLLVIDEIIGSFEHSSSCQATTQTTLVPRVPLHPELRDFALGLFRRHVPLAQVQIECRDFAQKKWGSRSGDENYRFQFTAQETTSMYRTLRCEMSIPRRSQVEDNIDKWFRSENPQPPITALSDALIHYQPHIPGQTERFELVLSTLEQRELAWRYGHKNIVLMDGTFGVCTARILLFILMVIDERNHGIPIAFLLFTAKQDAKAVHASYDRTILQALVSRFKNAMGSNHNGETFAFSVGMTDNDPREHHALRSQWPDIFLMLCLFHMSQAWRNALNDHLRVVPKGDPRIHVRRRIGKLLRRLLKEITEYNIAIAAYNSEVLYYRSQEQSVIEVVRKQALGALSFLSYLQDYLKDRAFWCTWSAASAVEAATRLNIPINTVPRTTNHLESFNGRLKNRYFQPYLRSGRLPRLDVYVMTLIKDVIPRILAERIERENFMEYRQTLTTSAGPRPAKRIGTTSGANLPATVEPPTRPETIQHISDAPTVDLDFLERDVEGDADDELEEPLAKDPDLLQLEEGTDDAVMASNPELPQKEGAAGDEWDYASEHALDEEDIVGDLEVTNEDELPFTLAQAPSTSTADALAELQRERAAQEQRDAAAELATSIQNQRMVAWRQLMLSQDESAKYLRELTQLGMKPSQLQEFMSDSIVRRMRRTPAQVLEADIDSEPKRHAEDEANTQAPKRAKFDTQLKEARKESYGFR